MHIAIAGNIGAGKTTLTKLLAKHYRWQAHYEEVLENPYLDDFYHEMERWSFNLQIYFLYNRFSQILDIQKSGKKIIQDRSIYEDAYIFAPNLHSMGLLTKRDLGSAPSPLNSFQVIQGLETLEVRMQKHSENALNIAKWSKSFMVF